MKAALQMQYNKEWRESRSGSTALWVLRELALRHPVMHEVFEEEMDVMRASLRWINEQGGLVRADCYL